MGKYKGLRNTKPASSAGIRDILGNSFGNHLTFSTLQSLPQQQEQAPSTIDTKDDDNKNLLVKNDIKSKKEASIVLSYKISKPKHVRPKQTFGDNINVDKTQKSDRIPEEKIEEIQQFELLEHSFAKYVLHYAMLEGSLGNLYLEWDESLDLDEDISATLNKISSALSIFALMKEQNNMNFQNSKYFHYTKRVKSLSSLASDIGCSNIDTIESLTDISTSGINLKEHLDELISRSLINGHPTTFALKDFYKDYKSELKQSAIYDNLVSYTNPQMLSKTVVETIEVCAELFSKDEAKELFFKVIDISTICDTLRFRAIASLIPYLEDSSLTCLDKTLSFISELENENPTEESLQRYCSIFKLISSVTKKYPTDISIEDWDYIFSVIGSCIDFVSRVDLDEFKKYSYAAFSVSLFGLIEQLITMISNYKDMMKNQDDIADIVIRLIDDLANFESSDTQEVLLNIFFKLTAADMSNKPSFFVMNAISKVIAQLDVSDDSLANHCTADKHVQMLGDLLVPNIKFVKIEDEKYGLIFKACDLMMLNHRLTIISAHCLIRRNCKKLADSCKNNLKKLFNNQDDLETIIVYPPEFITSALLTLDQQVDALLMDQRVGDVSFVPDFDDEAYNCLLAYFLLWDIVLEITYLFDRELKLRILSSLNELGLLARLFDNIFKTVLTENIRREINYKLVYKDTLQELEKLYKSPLLPPATVKSDDELLNICSYIYFNTCYKCPRFVKQWYNKLHNRALDSINKFTARNISPIIISIEMDSVQQKCSERLQSNNENTQFVIKARPNVKEVSAKYKLDDFQLELTIKLPPNYPLSPIQIDGGKRIGATYTQWRNWLLRLTIFLNQKSEAIVEGLELWKRGLEKKFESVDDCMICYSLLDVYQKLPKHSCQNCKKGVHSSCLYEWFKTSGNSTCPLCRSLW